MLKYFRELKVRLSVGWTFMRILRLILSVVIIIESVKAYDWMFGILGIFLLGQVILNVGCCGVSGCYTDVGNKSVNSEKNAPVSYEEIK